MDDVLNLIRELVERLEDPPEIPFEVVEREEELLSQQEQETSRSEMFDPPQEPHRTPTVNPPVPEMQLRQMKDLSTPDLSRNPVVPPVPPAAHMTQRQTFDVAPVETLRTAKGDPVEIYEPMRVAGAAATVSVREKFEAEPATPNTTNRVEHTQVTPDIRVSHFAPSDFPVDFTHALSLIDKEVSLPNMEIDTDPPVLPDYDPIERLQSSEQVTVDMSYADDSDERYVL